MEEEIAQLRETVIENVGTTFKLKEQMVFTIILRSSSYFNLRFKAIANN